MRLRQLFNAATVALSLIVPMSAAQAGTLTFLKDSPISHFQEADIQMMKSAARQLLDTGAKGAAREWKNSVTGNSGRIEVKDAFETDDGRKCKRLLVINRAKLLEGQATYPLCKSEGGDWRLDEAARPSA